MILDAIQKQIEAEYGRPLAEIEAAVEAAGYDVNVVRLPVSGETFLNTHLRIEYADRNFSSLPRLILRPKPKCRILLEETGQVRQANPGEWGAVEGHYPHCFECLSCTPLRIWTARELKPGETV